MLDGIKYSTSIYKNIHHVQFWQYQYNTVQLYNKNIQNIHII